MIKVQKIYRQSCLATFCFLLLSASCISQPGKIEEKKVLSHWEKIGPGGGGSTFIPTFSYYSSDHFLVRCDMTGSYLTHDGGQSYRQINFEGGGTSYAYDPKDSNIIYAGSSFLNRSADGGKTWQKIFPSANEIIKESFSGDHAELKIETTKKSLYENGAGNISNIRADAVSPGALYFSMDHFFFYTNNNGLNWEKYDCKDQIVFIYGNNSTKNEIFIFTTKEKIIFNKTSNTFSSEKFPETMTPVFSVTGGLIAGSGKTIFYALHQDVNKKIENEFGYTDVWTYDNTANNWKQIKNSFLINTQTGIKPSYSSIACPEYDAANAYLITNRYEEKNDAGLIDWYGAIKTNDEGNHWHWVWKGGGGSGKYRVKDGIGVSNLNDAWVEKAFGGEYIRLIDAGVYPNNGNIALITDWYRVMKTVDGGKTWNQVYSSKQADGTFSSNGMDVTTSYGVHFDPYDSNHIAISYTDIGYHHSFNKGKSWERSVAGVPAEWNNTCYWVVFDPDLKGKAWSAWSGVHDLPRGKMTRDPNWKQHAEGGICVSENGGKSWKVSNEGMGFDAPTTCIVLDPNSAPGNRTLYACVYNKGVFKSTDDGKTWRIKNKGIGKNTCAFELTLTKKGDLFLVISPIPAHTNNQPDTIIYSGAVYKSVDGAETWTKLNITNRLLFPSGIDFDRSNPDRIYVACWSDINLSDLIGSNTTKRMGGDKILKMQGGIFLSEDDGSTWRSVFDDKQYVYDVTVDEFDRGRLYCNTFNSAAYRSDDNGKTWIKINGYDFHWGHRVIVDRNDPEKIYLTTYGSSVWHGIPVTNE